MRDKLGRFMKSYHPLNLGKPHKEEAKRKMSLAHKGKKLSEETKRKMSEALKGRPAWNKGKTHSEEWKKKMREITLRNGNKPPSALGKKRSEETKQKMRLSTLEYIKKVVGIFSPRIGYNEKQILDKLEKELNYKIIRQFKVCGYFIDGYISELKLG